MMKGTAAGELWRRIKKEFLAPVPVFTIVELSIALMFIVACIVDVSTDIFVAAEYFDKEMPLYGALTSIVIVISSFFVCACGLYNYEMEYRNEGRLSQGGTVEYIASGYKSRTADTDKERQWHQKAMLRKQRVIRVLGLADSFMESAPQLCLQLYVLIKLNPRKDVVGEVLRVVGLLSSWFSLAGAVVGWYKSRLEDAGKEVGLKSQIIYILWRLAETGGRVLCIAYFASVFGLWVLLVLVVHWVVLLLWYLIFFKNGTNDGTLVFFGSSAIYTYSLMFCYLHHQEGPSRYRYIVFYIIFYLENFVMLVVASSATEGPWILVPHRHCG
nr:hypothetical protein BaRGS_001954 [Batillaria attramentaria]